MGATAYTSVKYGSQGNDVLELQKLLNQNGYNLKEDGEFDVTTHLAVKRYQKENDLTVDGIVGDKTWGALTSGTPSNAGTGNDANKGLSYNNFTNDSYKASDAVTQALAALNTHLGTKPSEYRSSWQNQINSIIDKILNREEFSYDLNADAFYQQYRDQYIQQGKLAMADAMGQAAAMTGGYGNSYAATVGNQAYQSYLSELNNVVPELRQMELDKYNQDGDALYNAYALLSDQENQDYNRYQDEFSQWQNDFLRLYDQYNTERKLAADSNEIYVDSSADDNSNAPMTSIPDSIRNKLDSIESNTAAESYLESLEASGVIDHATALQLMGEYLDVNEIYNENEDGTKSISYKEMVKSTHGWSVVDNGGTNWFWGVDNNAIVKAPNGEQIRLDNLVDKLVAEGMSKSDAKSYVKKLQKNLKI